MNQIHPDTHYRIQRSAQEARITRSRRPKVERPARKVQVPQAAAMVAALVTMVGGVIVDL